MASITHEQLGARLKELAIDVPVDYLHGVLTGLVCASLPTTDPLWREHLGGCLPDVEIDTHATVLEALQALCEQSLGNSDFTFRLLLPEDDEFLSLRAQSLSQWCDGFVMAFLAGQKTMGDDERESIDDLYAISQMAPDEEYNDPAEAHQHEGDYTNLCEYVRVAVLSLFDAGPTDAVPPAANA